MDPVTLTLGKKYTRNRVAPAYATSLYNPAVDIVYDSCYRDVDSPLDIYANGIKTDSGHGWEAVEVDGRTPTLTYLPGGGLRLNTTGGPTNARTGISLIAGETFVTPFLSARVYHDGTFQYGRRFILKYIDSQNWLSIETHTYDITVVLCVAGNVTTIASYNTRANISFSRNLYHVYADVRFGHSSLSPGAIRAVRVLLDGEQRILVGLTQEQWEPISEPGKIGFSAGQRTVLYGFSAGRNLAA